MPIQELCQARLLLRCLPVKIGHQSSSELLILAGACLASWNQRLVKNASREKLRVGRLRAEPRDEREGLWRRAAVGTRACSTRSMRWFGNRSGRVWRQGRGGIYSQKIARDCGY